MHDCSHVRNKVAQRKKFESRRLSNLYVDVGRTEILTLLQQVYTKESVRKDNSLASVWPSFSKKEKLKAAQIVSEPIILPSGRDAGWVPEWMISELRRLRLEWVIQRSYDKNRASDLEAAMYLCCASMIAPLSEQTCRIYFHVASRLTASLKRAMHSDPDFKDHLKLRHDDEKELARFKRWIRTSQKNGRNLNKAKVLCSLNDRSAHELECSDLLMAESQI